MRVPTALALGLLGILRCVGAEEVACDVVVAGGSTSSLAAAITAAEAAPDASICFTEITDWPGGQMTAGGVPAIDFTTPNAQADNQPASFRSAMASIPGDGAPHTATTGSGCPGACSVSTKCYLPNVLVEEWIMPRLARSKNLKVFLRTAIVGTERRAGGGADDECVSALERTCGRHKGDAFACAQCAGDHQRALAQAGCQNSVIADWCAGVAPPASGAVVSLRAVQRRPRPGGPPEWSQRLSAELPDWYSPHDSAVRPYDLVSGF